MGGYYERAGNGDGTYSQLIKITGSSVENIKVFNALAITDTLQHFWTPTPEQKLSFARAKEIQILYTNTLDQTLELSIDNDNISVASDGSMSPSYTLAKTSPYIQMLVTKDENKHLKTRFFNLTKIAVINTSIAPTTGSISLTISLLFG